MDWNYEIGYYLVDLMKVDQICILVDQFLIFIALCSRLMGKNSYFSLLSRITNYTK
jgi:hypothetical protein